MADPNQNPLTGATRADKSVAPPGQLVPGALRALLGG